MKPVLIIQNCRIEPAGTIKEYLEERSYPFTVIHSYSNNPYPEIKDIEAIVVLGTPDSAYEYQKYDYLKNLYAYVGKAIKEKKPYLGFCFGGQILAHLLGARVERNKIMEIGTYRVSLTDSGRSSFLFDNFPDKFPVFHWHGDTFKIPFPAENLAETDDCPNQAFVTGNAVALQFHLEATPDDVVRYCDSYGEELAQANKNKDEIIDEYRSNFDDIKKLNFVLLDNFFNNFVLD